MSTLHPSFFVANNINQRFKGDFRLKPKTILWLELRTDSALWFYRCKKRYIIFNYSHLYEANSVNLLLIHSYDGHYNCLKS